MILVYSSPLSAVVYLRGSPRPQVVWPRSSTAWTEGQSILAEDQWNHPISTTQDGKVTKIARTAGICGGGSISASDSAIEREISWRQVMAGV